MLPESVAEGDYIEIGNIGAYGRAIAGRFNGFGAYEQAILLDPPMLSVYGPEAGTGHNRGPALVDAAAPETTG